MTAAHVGAALLALVFLAAASGKLLAPREFARALVDFGVLRRTRPAAAVVVGVTEAAVGAALVVPATTRIATGCAAVLLLAFTVLIGRSLARGDRFACNCFGSGHSPISRRTLARNLVLLLGTAVVAAWALQLDLSASSWTHVVAAACAAGAIAGTTLLVLELPTLLGLNVSWARGYRTAIRSGR